MYPSDNFWSPRSSHPTAGAIKNNVKQTNPSFWYPRKYDLSAVAWGNEALIAQTDPTDEIRYTYWKKPEPPKKEDKK